MPGSGRHSCHLCVIKEVAILRNLLTADARMISHARWHITCIDLHIAVGESVAFKLMCFLVNIVFGTRTIK
jgi:hypothetical protein